MKNEPIQEPLDSNPIVLTTEDNKITIATYILSALALVFVLSAHLLSAFITGFLVFQLVHKSSTYLSSRFAAHGQRTRILVVVLVATIVVGGLAFGITALTKLIITGSDNLPALMKKMAEILESSRAKLPAQIAQYFPQDIQSFQHMVIEWLRNHAVDIQNFGKSAGKVLAHILIGAIIAIFVVFSGFENGSGHKPLALALRKRISTMATAFDNIVFAQAKIAFINAFVTGIYLIVVLPLLGISLPFTKTLTLVTFVFCFLPIIGNLMSNTMIVVVSMSYSLWMAVASLVFLVVVHKLEYFLNARIIGGHIKAKAYELLIAMLVFEAVFGLPGVVAAPIFYAYLKAELHAASQI